MRLLPDAKWREVVSRIQHKGQGIFNTSRNNHAVFVLLYLINILLISYSYFVLNRIKNK